MLYMRPYVVTLYMKHSLPLWANVAFK